MTTLKALYEYFSYKLPESLREEWDNDGIMVSADPDAPSGGSSFRWTP